MKLTSKSLERQLERVRKLESNVTFQFSMIAKLMDLDALALLADTPLTLTSYRALKTVETFEEISIADLSRHMVSDSAQISRVVAELSKNEFVEFNSDPTNKRRKLVVLSAKGHKLMESLAPRFEKRRQAVEDLLGDEIIDDLRLGFAKLVEHFSK